jgi:hypothetical protein
MATGSQMSEYKSKRYIVILLSDMDKLEPTEYVAELRDGRYRLEGMDRTYAVDELKFLRKVA